MNSTNSKGDEHPRDSAKNNWTLKESVDSSEIRVDSQDVASNKLVPAKANLSQDDQFRETAELKGIGSTTRKQNLTASEEYMNVTVPKVTREFGQELDVGAQNQAAQSQKKRIFLSIFFVIAGMVASYYLFWALLLPLSVALLQTMLSPDGFFANLLSLAEHNPWISGLCALVPLVLLVSDTARVGNLLFRRGRTKSVGRTLNPIVARIALFILTIIMAALLAMMSAFGSMFILNNMESEAANYYKHGDYRKAADSFSSLIDIYRFTGSRINNKRRADCYFHLKDYQREVDDLTEVIKAQPYQTALYTDAAVHVGAYLARANAYDKLGLHDLANEDRKQAEMLGTKLDPYSVAQEFLDERDYEDVAQIYSYVIGANPKSAIPYVNRGQWFVKLGRYDRAVADYSKAIGMFPRYGEAFYRRGEAYQRLGKKELADKDKTMAKKLGYKLE